MFIQSERRITDELHNRQSSLLMLTNQNKSNLLVVTTNALTHSHVNRLCRKVLSFKTIRMNGILNTWIQVIFFVKCFVCCDVSEGKHWRILISSFIEEFD